MLLLLLLNFIPEEARRDKASHGVIISPGPQEQIWLLGCTPQGFPWRLRPAVNRLRW